MKQNRTFIGVAVVLALAVTGVILLTGPEPQMPETAPTGAMVAVPPEPAEPQPAEPAPATATSEPAAAEVKAELEAPAPPETQAPEIETPETELPQIRASAPKAPESEFPQVRANTGQAPVTQAPAAQASAASEPAQVAAIPKAAEAEAPPESQPAAPQVAPQVEATPPSFDVVRVERSGEAVIAGRAEPGSEVILRAGDRILGRVTADGRGQWVIVLATPLGPGDYELSLESRLPGGEMLLSENVVVVSVPQPQIAAMEPVAPSQPEVAAPPETLAREAPSQPAPEQQAPAQPAPSESAPGAAAGEADSAAQAAPMAPSIQETQTAQPTAPKAQIAAAEPAAVSTAVPTAEAPAPAPPTIQAEPEAPAPQIAAANAVVEAPAPAPQVAAVEPVAAAPAPAPQVAAVEPVAEAPVSAPPALRVESEAPAPQSTTAMAPMAAPASEVERPLAVLMPRSGEGRIRVLQQAESASGGLGEGALILETVDYDAEGRALVGGRAEANSHLIVYLDNRPAAQAQATLSGHWQATLARSIAPGLHTLRIDQLAGNGQVSARVETPFSRAAVLAALPSESAVIVQPGNSLWRISRRVYGEGVRYSVIYQANRDQIREPDLIYPGQIFVVPATN